jgi:hypothetical protein
MLIFTYNKKFTLQKYGDNKIHVCFLIIMILKLLMQYHSYINTNHSEYKSADTINKEVE